MRAHEAASALAEARAQARAIRAAVGLDGLPVPVVPDVADVADAASAVYDHEVAQSLAVAIDEELVDLDAAAARLDAGTFGRCEGCGRPIDAARLQALPWASRCLACQVRAETWDLSLRADVVHGPDERCAVRNSDLIPDDDADERIELSAEEQALHLEP